MVKDIKKKAANTEYEEMAQKFIGQLVEGQSAESLIFPQEFFQAYEGKKPDGISTDISIDFSSIQQSSTDSSSIEKLELMGGNNSSNNSNNLNGNNIYRSFQNYFINKMDKEEELDSQIQELERLESLNFAALPTMQKILQYRAQNQNRLNS